MAAKHRPLKKSSHGVELHMDEAGELKFDLKCKLKIDLEKIIQQNLKAKKYILTL